MSLIDTYQLATCGQNLINTFTLASNGILLDVVIEDLPDIVVPRRGGSTGYGEPGKEERIKVKKVTVIATINGEEYKESIIVKNRPNLQINDLDIQVTESVKPKIKILLKG